MVVGMNYPIEMHGRGRQIVECEAYDTRSDKPIVKPGILMTPVELMRKRPDVITVSIPTASMSQHKFRTVDSGDGYGYEGEARKNGRGWRIRLDQITWNETVDA